MKRDTVSCLTALPLVMVALCLCAVAGGLLRYSHASLAVANIAILLTILVGCGAAAIYRLVRVPVRVWFPIEWFLLTSAAYYGFGPLLYYFGRPETVFYADKFYPVDDMTLLRVNTLTAIGISAVLGSYMVTRLILFCMRAELAGVAAERVGTNVPALRTVAWVFAAVGLPVKMLLVLPRALGLWDVVIPGSIEYLSSLSTLALAPLFLLQSRPNRSRISGLFFYGLLVIEFMTAFVTLSKLAMIKVVVIACLAMALAGRSFKRIGVVGAIAVVLYATVLTPIVTYGRFAFNVRGLQQLSEAKELLADTRSGSAHEALGDLLPGVQSWWSRLNYANAQAFAVAAYDEGNVGDTFELAVWVFVPRLFFPDKPIMTTGDKFNDMVTGNPDSMSAPGMLAEGYWNLGWSGVGVVALVMGCLYGFWDRYAALQLKHMRLQHLPVIYLGILMAIQQDSWFIPGTVGSIATAVVFHLMFGAVGTARKQGRIVVGT